MLDSVEATLASFMILGQLDCEEALIALSDLLRGKESTYEHMADIPLASSQQHQENA